MNFYVGTRAIAAFAAAMALAMPAFAEPPALVAAYAQQIVRQCGGVVAPDIAAQLVQHADLNHDQLDDWIVDSSRYPCANRPVVFADQGFQVTIFMARADGHALPAFQRSTFGSRIEGKPETGYSLWLTLGGNDCGEASPKARCDRRVVWRMAERRFDLAPLAPSPTEKSPR